MAPPSILEAGLFSMGEASLPEWQLQEFAEYRAARMLLAFAPPLLCAIGVTGNVMTLLVLTLSALRHSACCKYLAAVAVTDTMILILNLCFNFVDVFVQRLRVSDLACKMYYFLFFTCVHLSSWLLVAVTSQRCLVICRPMTSYFVTSNRCTVCVIGGLTLASVGLNSHQLAVRELVWNNSTSQLVCYTRGETSRMFVRDYWPWVDAAAYSFVPASCLVVLNVLIIRTLRKAASFRNHHQSHPNRFKMSPANRKCGQSRQNNCLELQANETGGTRKNRPISTFSKSRPVAGENTTPSADIDHLAVNISSATQIKSPGPSPSASDINSDPNADSCSMESNSPQPEKLTDPHDDVVVNASFAAEMRNSSTSPASVSNTSKGSAESAPPQTDDVTGTSKNVPPQAPPTTKASTEGTPPCDANDDSAFVKEANRRSISSGSLINDCNMTFKASLRGTAERVPPESNGLNDNVASRDAEIDSRSESPSKTTADVSSAKQRTSINSTKNRIPQPRYCLADDTATDVSSVTRTSSRFESPVSPSKSPMDVFSADQKTTINSSKNRIPQPRCCLIDDTATYVSSATGTSGHSESPVSPSKTPVDNVATRAADTDSRSGSPSKTPTDVFGTNQKTSISSTKPRCLPDDTIRHVSTATGTSTRSESPVSPSETSVDVFSTNQKTNTRSTRNTIPQPRCLTAYTATHVSSATAGINNNSSISESPASSSTTLKAGSTVSKEITVLQPRDPKDATQRTVSEEGANGRGQSRQLTMMPLLASVVFVSLSAPIAVILVVEHLVWHRDSPRQVAVYTLVRIVVNTLMYLNHSVNFLLYCFAGSSFRSHWYALFCCVNARARLSSGCHRRLAVIRTCLYGMFKVARINATASASYAPDNVNTVSNNKGDEGNITLNSFRFKDTEICSVGSNQ